MAEKNQEALDQIKGALENIEVDELSDADLEDVSGGWCSISGCSNDNEESIDVAR